jgi:hypothetical protein
MWFYGTDYFLAYAATAPSCQKFRLRLRPFSRETGILEEEK